MVIRQAVTLPEATLTENEQFFDIIVSIVTMVTTSR